MTKIITDYQFTDKFIKWLPELQENEVFYFSLYSRRKYNSALPYSELKLSEFIVQKKEHIIEKLHRLECPDTGYMYEHGSKIIPYDSLVLYMYPNPKNLLIASKNISKRLMDVLYNPSKNAINPLSITMSEIQKSVIRKPYMDFDFDNSNYKDLLPKITEYINRESISIIETRSGFHLLIQKDRVEQKYQRSWYKNISALPNMDAGKEKMIPVPGTIQGLFQPKLFTDFS